VLPRGVSVPVCCQCYFAHVVYKADIVEQSSYKQAFAVDLTVVAHDRECCARLCAIAPTLFSGEPNRLKMLLLYTPQDA